MMNLGYSNSFTAPNRYTTSLPTVAPQVTLPPAPPTSEFWGSGDTVSLGGDATGDLMLMPSPWKFKEAIASRDLPFDISASRPAFSPHPISSGLPFDISASRPAFTPLTPAFVNGQSPFAWNPPTGPAFVNGQAPALISPSTWGFCAPTQPFGYDPRSASNDTGYLWNPPLPGVPASWAQ